MRRSQRSNYDEEHQYSREDAFRIFCKLSIDRLGNTPGVSSLSTEKQDKSALLINVLICIFVCILFTEIPETPKYLAVIVTIAIFYPSIYRLHKRITNTNYQEERSEYIKNYWISNISYLAGLADSEPERKLIESLLLKLDPSSITPQAAIYTSLMGERYAYHADIAIGGSIVVEVDGKKWHDDYESYIKDLCRDQDINRKGFRVVRVTSDQIMSNPDRTAEKLIKILHANICTSAIPSKHLTETTDASCDAITAIDTLKKSFAQTFEYKICKFRLTEYIFISSIGLCISLDSKDIECDYFNLNTNRCNFFEYSRAISQDILLAGYFLIRMKSADEINISLIELSLSQRRPPGSEYDHYRDEYG